MQWDEDMGAPVDHAPLGSEGRYKPVFHWNERIGQLCMDHPPIDRDVWERICDEADSGSYPAREELRPHHVVTILRKLKLMKFRERWKWILRGLNGKYPMGVLDEETKIHAEVLYKAIERKFWDFKGTMPKSLIRKAGKALWRVRHNVIPFNYLFRKVMEVWGERDFHWELPLLRSTAKLHALDDVAEIIFKSQGIPFVRTAVIKWPKIRKRRV